MKFEDKIKVSDREREWQISHGYIDTLIILDGDKFYNERGFQFYNIQLGTDTDGTVYGIDRDTGKSYNISNRTERELLPNETWYGELPWYLKSTRPEVKEAWLKKYPQYRK